MGHKGVNTEEARSNAAIASSNLFDRANQFLHGAVADGNAVQSCLEGYTAQDGSAAENRAVHIFTETETPEGARILEAAGQLTVTGTWDTDPEGVYAISVEFPQDIRELPQVQTEKNGHIKTAAVRDFPRLLGHVAGLIPEVQPVIS